MRGFLVPSVLFAVVLVGCDLQPPPKKQPPTAQRAGQNPAQPGSGSGGTAQVVVTPTNPVPPTNKPADKPPAPPPAAMSCLDIGSHFANIYERTSEEPTEKASLEQQRTTLVKSLADACTKGNWSDDVRTCIAKATTRAALTQCTSMVRVKNDGDPATP
ncbi:MAG: hypothetical protein KF773_40160 [Deltaproteobacteria bacterium]|nr:hypothetical protein [Deltaproteobacteria bacterium]MCW5804348.1 hypothetical protein [Deltaproteobacteria bacterium]